MKACRPVLAIVIQIFFFLPSAARQVPQFESLRLSSAPSFVILGVEPENISRPVSPTSFIGGIQNAVANGKLKPNFAMEFSPHYLINPIKDSSRFNPLEYVAPERNVFKNIGKTFSISTGTSESDSATFGKLIPGTALGIGVRFTLIEGKPGNGKLRELLDWNEAMIKESFLSNISILVTQVQTTQELEELVDIQADTFKTITLPRLALNSNKLSYSYSERMIDELVRWIRKRLKVDNLTTVKDSLNSKLLKLNSEQSIALARINTTKYPFAKQGFMLEMAAGEAILFQKSEWQNPAHAKAAVWITPSYRWDVSNANKENVSLLDAMGVLRYTFNNKKDSVDLSDYLDTGIKGKYTYNRWSASIEGVYRYAMDIDKTKMKKNYTYRLTAALDFKINELLTLKANFGTTFNGNTTTYTDPKKLFGLAGINMNLFK